MTAIAFPHIWVPKPKRPIWPMIWQMAHLKKGASGHLYKGSAGHLSTTCPAATAPCACATTPLSATVTFTGIIHCAGCLEDATSPDITYTGNLNTTVNVPFSSGDTVSCFFTGTFPGIITQTRYVRTAGSCAGAPIDSQSDIIVSVEFFVTGAFSPSCSVQVNGSPIGTQHFTGNDTSTGSCPSATVFNDQPTNCGVLNNQLYSGGGQCSVSINL